MGHGVTRQQIVKAADDLFYRQGFEHTSFSHIAKVVNISRGNFYHHFKTKNDILDAVIQGRLDHTRQMLVAWENEAATPKQRVKSFLEVLLKNWDLIKDYGCPVGTLCSELAKLNHGARAAANQVFTLFRMWLKQQFLLMGLVEEADALAMRVLSWSQGVATLGNAFDDYDYVKREVDQMCAWIDGLETVES